MLVDDIGFGRVYLDKMKRDKTSFVLFLIILQLFDIL